MKTFTLTWNNGEIVARDEAGRPIAVTPWLEPITASSDSRQIAESVMGDTGCAIESVDHDGEFVFVNCA